MHVDERIADYSITVCQTVADSSSMKLQAVAGRVNRQRNDGEGEAGGADTMLPHGVNELECLVRTRTFDVAGDDGVVGDSVPLGHSVEHRSRVLHEARAEERRQKNVVGEDVGLGGGGRVTQERNGGRGSAEAGVGGGEAVGEVWGAEEGAGAAEEAGMEAGRGGAGGAASEERGGDPWSEEWGFGRGGGHQRHGGDDARRSAAFAMGCAFVLISLSDS